MTKRSPIKLLPVWIAVSAALLIAGIVLFALLGFNLSPDRASSKSFEVSYDIVLEINELEEGVQDACEDAFESAGVTYLEKSLADVVTGNPPTSTGSKLLRYVFSAETADSALESAAAAVRSALSQGGYAASETTVAVHSLGYHAFGEGAWRGAVALAVGAVVALLYLGIRFGAAAALTGITVCVHDALLSLALLAVTRIPVYAFALPLYAAIAAVLSLLFWLVRCMKLREIAKEPAGAALMAEETVARSGAEAKGALIALPVAVAALIVVLVVAGLVASAGLWTIALPALACVAVAAYSAWTFAPALHVPVKGAFDKMRRKKKQGYTGKKKAEEARA